MSFSPTNSDAKSEEDVVLTDEKLERVFREIEEASERRAMLEAAREKEARAKERVKEKEKEKGREKEMEGTPSPPHSTSPLPLDPLVSALSDVNAGLLGKEGKRRRQSITISRVGSYPDVPAELHRTASGVTSPVQWSASPLYRAHTHTTSTTSLTSTSSLPHTRSRSHSHHHSNPNSHPNESNSSLDRLQHEEDLTHTTQKETIVGRRNTLTKAMSNAFSRGILTRMRSRGALNEAYNYNYGGDLGVIGGVEGEGVVIGVKVHEARTENVEESGDHASGQTGAGESTLQSESGGKEASTSDAADPSRRMSITTTTVGGPPKKSEREKVGTTVGARDRSGSISKLRGKLPMSLRSPSSTPAPLPTPKPTPFDARQAAEDALLISGASGLGEDASKGKGEGNGNGGSGGDTPTKDGTTTPIPIQTSTSVSITPIANANVKQTRRISYFAKALAARLRRKKSEEGKEKEREKEKGKQNEKGKDKDKSGIKQQPSEERVGEEDKEKRERERYVPPEPILTPSAVAAATSFSSPSPSPTHSPSHTPSPNPSHSHSHSTSLSPAPSHCTSNFTSTSISRSTSASTSSKKGKSASLTLPTRIAILEERESEEEVREAAAIPLPPSPAPFASFAGARKVTPPILTAVRMVQTIQEPENLPLPPSPLNGSSDSLRRIQGSGEGTGVEVDPAMISLPPSPSSLSFQDKSAKEGKEEEKTSDSPPDVVREAEREMVTVRGCRLPPSALPDSDFGPLDESEIGLKEASVSEGEGEEAEVVPSRPGGSGEDTTEKATAGL